MKKPETLKRHDSSWGDSVGIYCSNKLSWLIYGPGFDPSSNKYHLPFNHLIKTGIITYDNWQKQNKKVGTTHVYSF